MEKNPITIRFFHLPKKNILVYTKILKDQNIYLKNVLLGLQADCYCNLDQKIYKDNIYVT